MLDKIKSKIKSFSTKSVEVQVLDKYTQRMVDEWRKHGKLILAVDFDGTLFPDKNTTQKECDELVNYLISIQDKLHIIIWTAAHKNRHQNMENYCVIKGLNVIGVNVPALPDIKYGKDGKPYFNLLIDDRAGKEEAINKLKQAYKEVYVNI